MRELLVSKTALKNNVSVIRERAAGRRLMAVLKGDAYGLGLADTARFLYDEGLRSFAVYEPHEAALLREKGLTDVEILMLRSTTDEAEIEALLDAQAALTIGSQEAAVAAGGVAGRRSTVAEAHLRVDTGHNGFGFRPDAIEQLRAVYQHMESIAVSGVYTHYDPAAPLVRLQAQAQLFDNLLAKLRSLGLETGLVHAAGSAVLFSQGTELPLYDMLRIGAAWSGQLPALRHTGLTPAVMLHAALAGVDWLPAGTVLSDGQVIKKAMRVGLVPLGYADGFGVETPTFTRRAAWRRLLRRLRRPAPALYTSDGDRLRLAVPAGAHHLTVNLTHTELQSGAEVYADASPLYCAHIPRVFR